MRLVFFLQVAKLGLKFGAQSAKASRPAMVSADDGGVYQKFFPADGDGKPGFFDGIIRRGGVRRGRGAREVGQDFVVGRNPLRNRFDRRAVLIHGRELAERQILGEARSGAAVGGAGEQRQKSASRGIRPRSAAAEIAWNRRAAQGFFHKRLVLLDIAQQDRDAVERGALRGERANAPGDFHALQVFAGAEKSSSGSGGAAGGCSGEKSQVRTRSSVVVGGDVSRSSGVMLRSMRVRPWCGGSSPLMTVARTSGDFSISARRNRSWLCDSTVMSASRIGSPVKRFGLAAASSAAKLSSIGRSASDLCSSSCSVQLHQVRQVLAGKAGGEKFGRGDVFEAQFGNGACESAREAGSLRHGREVAQFVRALRGIHDSSGDSFDAETTDGRERSPAHGLRGEMGRELYGRERVDSLAALRKRRKRELIRGGARGSENQDFRLGMCGKERGGMLEEFRRGAATEQRASGHTQLLLARWARSLAWGLGMGGEPIDVILRACW